VLASAFGPAAALGAASLVGCGQAVEKAPARLRWYSWGPELPLAWTVGPGLNPRGSTTISSTPQATPVPPQQLLQQQVASFVAEHEDVEVEIMTERADQYHNKLAALAAAGVVPDVVAYDGAQAVSLIRSNAFYVLSQLQASANRDFLEAFPQPHLDASQYRGRLYGVPYQVRQLVLFVNKSAFDGLSLPPVEWGNANWTWAHFLEKAVALTQRGVGGGIQRFGTILTGRPFWAALIRQNGGLEFSRDGARSYYDTPEVYDAIQWAVDLVWRYHVAPREDENVDGRTWNFDQGNVAMWAWYQHAIPLVNQRARFDWDVYPLPSQRRTGTYADWGYLSIAAASTAVDHAWSLIRFLATPAGDSLALRDGVAAPVYRGSEPAFMTGTPSKSKAATIQALNQPMLFRPQRETWAQVQSLINLYLRPLWLGSGRAVYACRELRVAVDAVLAGLSASGETSEGEPDETAPSGG
jgi:multiple sugar transport system substrate-binding protein